MSRKPHWYIDTYILDSKPEAAEKLRAALSKYPVTYTKYIPFTDTQEGLTEFNPYEINLCYGTHGFIRNMQNTFGQGEIEPYLVEKDMECISYYTKVPNEWLLNAGCFFVPFSVLANAIETFACDYYDDVFVRPNSGFKSFVPCVIETLNPISELTELKDKFQVADDTLCLVAPAQRLDFEIRYVIVDRKVISASYYRLHGQLYEKFCLQTKPTTEIKGLEKLGAVDFLFEAQQLAEKMAAHDWQPSVAYMCDVALTEGGVCKIVELNAFSCAGLYDCDYEKVFDAVTQAVSEQY